MVRVLVTLIRDAVVPRAREPSAHRWYSYNSERSCAKAHSPWGGRRRSFSGTKTVVFSPRRRSREVHRREVLGKTPLSSPVGDPRYVCGLGVVLGASEYSESKLQSQSQSLSLRTPGLSCRSGGLLAVVRRRRGAPAAGVRGPRPPPSLPPKTLSVSVVASRRLVGGETRLSK